MPKIKKKTIAEPKTLYKKASKETLAREEEELELFGEEESLVEKKVANTLDRIETELADIGVVPFENQNVDSDYLILPADITEETSKELGRYFNAFTQQKMWTRTILGRLYTTVREMKRSIDDVKADVFSAQPAKMSIKEKELKFQVHPDARQILDDMFVYEEKLQMMREYLANLEDAIILISREISRRGQDWEMEQRVENVSKKRR